MGGNGGKWGDDGERWGEMGVAGLVGVVGTKHLPLPFPLPLSTVGAWVILTEHGHNQHGLECNGPEYVHYPFWFAIPVLPCCHNLSQQFMSGCVIFHGCLYAKQAHSWISGGGLVRALI